MCGAINCRGGGIAGGMQEWFMCDPIFAAPYVPAVSGADWCDSIAGIGACCTNPGGYWWW